MKVHDLICQLSKMPFDADVVIDVDDSMAANYKEVKSCVVMGGTLSDKFVVLAAEFHGGKNG